MSGDLSEADEVQLQYVLILYTVLGQSTRDSTICITTLHGDRYRFSSQIYV